MNFTLESLNHILTVITVTAFLYSRKNYFKDIIDAHLIPGRVENRVHSLYRKIAKRIQDELAKNKKASVIGIQVSPYDLDDKEIQDLLKMKISVQRIASDFTANEYNKIKNEYQQKVKKINNRFTNTSFYIALVSFFLLILAAGFQHEDSYEIEVFLSFYNLINFIVLFCIYFTFKQDKNTTIINYFLLSIFLSFIIPKLFHNQLHKIYTNLYSNDFALSVVQYFTKNAYSFVLFLSLIILLLPWVLCFLRFWILFFISSYKLSKKEKPTLLRLEKFNTVLDVKEDIKTNGS